MSSKVTYLFFFLLVAAQTSGWSQTEVRGCVNDADNGEPLAFCHVAMEGSTVGTVTNNDGCFALSGLNPSDTLVVSYIGYRSLKIAVSQFQGSTVIALEPESFEIGELTVYAENDYLYEKVYACSRQLRKMPADTTRAYFLLETVEKGRPIEMIECYYNATVQGLSVMDLGLKNGRAGWPLSAGGHFFMNHSTSKALVLLDPTEPSDRYPFNPLQYRPGRMKKRFELFHLPSFSSKDVMHIGFEPKVIDGSFFSGEMWIDAETNQLLKLVLQAPDAAQYPFKPLNTVSKINSLALDITYLFEQSGGTNKLQDVHFNIDLNMLHDWAGRREVLEVSTSGMLYMYDYQSSFLLPFYDYDPAHSDYRKISFFPYDSVFWANTSGFILSREQKERLRFFEEEGVILNFDTDLLIKGHGKDTLRSFFEQSNITWSESERISVKQLEESDSLASKVFQGRPPESIFESDKLKLTTKLFLDVNVFEDSIHYTSQSVIDVFDSYNLLDESDLIDCIANILFDISEIARRKMLAELEPKGYDQQAISKIYDAAVKDMRSEQKRFIREVDLGRNFEVLLEWNADILSELGIDNIALFNLEAGAPSE